MSTHGYAGHDGDGGASRAGHDGDPGRDPRDAYDRGDDPGDDFDDFDDFEDGNALAGPLSEVFAVDLTAAVARCVHCGSTGPVAALRVYARGPGFTARCPDCAQVILRLVRGPNTAWLDMRGTVSLAVPLDA